MFHSDQVNKGILASDKKNNLLKSTQPKHIYCIYPISADLKCAFGRDDSCLWLFYLDRTRCSNDTIYRSFRERVKRPVWSSHEIWLQ